MKKYQLMAPGPTPVPSEVLLAMARLSPQPGNALAIRICRASKEHHLVAHCEFPMSLPIPCAPGAPMTPARRGTSLPRCWSPPMQT